MLALDFLHKGVSRFPDRTLVTDGLRSFTYAEMGHLADRIASRLIAEGIIPGDRVAILSPNHPMVLACQYGTIRAGAVWVPVNYRNTPADTLRQLDSLEVAAVFFHSSLTAHLDQIRDRAATASTFVCADAGLAEWADGTPARSVFPVAGSDDTVVILTTSGTTGTPKGAMHSHRALEAMIASFYAMMPFDEPPVHLVVAPLTHAAGIYHWTMLALGGTNFILNSVDPEAILRTIQNEKVSTLFLPPTLIYMLLAHPKLRSYDYSSLRYLVYGSAPMSVEKLREALDVFGPVMTQCYGQSECLMMATILTNRDHLEIMSDPAIRHRIAAAGRAGPFCRVEIVNDDGASVPDGGLGEIVFRSQYVMTGYYGNAEATADAGRFGWHHTGDIGYRDTDGYVYLVDRKGDMINSGGFNVLPGEVEQAVLAFPSVQDCAVVGVPHEKWGEAVLAAVELKPGHELDAAALIGFCKERLGSVKAPKFVEVWETLPRSTVGKTLRREVRAKYWAGRERAI